MYGQPFGDRIREHKTTIIQVIVAVAIAVVVCAIMTPQLAPSKGYVNTAITGLETDMAQASASINTLRTNLDTRMDALEDNTQGFASQINAIDNDISTLQGWSSLIDPRITALESQNSPPEAYLTGNLTAGNVTIHAKASDPGNFTANIHLVFSPPIYAGLNWTTSITYVPVMSYNGTDWGTSQVWWNIGTFALAAGTSTSIDITFAGLVNQPSFAYVEIYPAL